MTIHTAEELADAADARAEGDRRSQDRASMIVYVPGSLPDRDELIAAHDGIKSFVNEERLAEGVVLRTASGKPIAQLGRNTFKVISNKYLLKERA